MVSGAIPGQNFPSITTEKGKQRLIDAIPDVGFYRTPDRKLSFNRPEMNTISLLADPNIGPQNIVAVPLGGGNTGGERTGLMGPTQQPETPSEQYMREMKTEAPIPTPSPDAALKLGLIGGEAVAQDRNQGNLLSGLLGDIDYKGILNQLVKTFQRPEMLTPGVNALTAFGMSGAALNQAEMAGAAAEQERMDKLALEQIKNAPGAPKITAEAVKLYDRVNTSRANATLVQKMKQALIEGPGTGGIGTGEQALIAMLNALNIPIGTSGRSDYNSLLAELKTGMLRSGRLLKADFELLEKQLPKSGTFKNRDQLLKALRKVEEKSNRQLFEDQQILKTFDLPVGSGAMPSTMIRSRNN